MRLYYAARNLELTLNARWNGSSWERENLSLSAARLIIARNEVRFQQVATTLASPFADAAWSGANAKEFVLDADAIGFGEQVVSGRERQVSTGPLTGYSGDAGRVGLHEQQHRRRRFIRVGSPAGCSELGDLHGEGREQYR